MSIGLLGLLDDVAAIAKVAAASLDDVAAQAAKAGAKAAAQVADIFCRAVLSEKDEREASSYGAPMRKSVYGTCEAVRERAAAIVGGASRRPPRGLRV